ncbi:ATP-binding protein [Rhizobacter sp. LjRoot28]|uniref:ATP-binding protein n=1 Tax=Rhizobacter sp. LjRoot28 TaxID=3342309 RepID=UPI003ECDB5CF
MNSGFHETGAARDAYAFQHRPLRFKLAALLGVCAALTAAFVSVTMFAFTWWSLDQDARQDATEIAQSLAYSLSAPLAFEDVAGLNDALSVLRTRPQVKGAWVHDRHGVPQVIWGDVAAAPPPGPLRGGLLSGHVTYSETITATGGADRIGLVTVHVGLGEERRLLAWQAVAAVSAALLGLALSLGVSRRLSERISRPILELAETASAIASGRTYDQRLQAVGRDEVGQAVSAFNTMISEVQRRGEALAEMNRALEQQVQARTLSMQRAEAASIAKTRFLSNMSHELRSPLNGVIGAAQLLQAEGTLDDRRSELVDIIRTSGSNLLGLIDSILDLARIESGEMALDHQPFDLIDCLEAAMATSAVPARAKGLQLAVVVSPGVPAQRRGDALRLRQVLLNLIGNAVKFTLQGEVVVRVKPGRGEDDLMIQVSDTGIGMEQTGVDAIFEPFRQADESTTRRFGGTGLGLAISRQIVELMGGEIAVTSAPGVGSCFTVTLKLPVVNDPAAPAPSHRATVAFIEPHEASADALQALLERLGYPTRRCLGAAEVHAFIEQEEGWLLVAADVPGAADLVAAAEARLGVGRVIAMTGLEGGRHVRHWHSSLTKPLVRASLAARLNARSTQPPAVAPRPAPVAGVSRVLVVEDDPVNQAIVGSMLTNAGFDVQLANDGADALDHFAAERFDLVLMDWQMPDMDGLEVTRRLRAGEGGPHGSQVPILALTANAFAEDRAACMAAGMNDFLTKPILASDLVGAALRWTRGAQRPPA